MYLLPLDTMEVMHSHLFSPPAVELNHQSCLAFSYIIATTLYTCAVLIPDVRSNNPLFFVSRIADLICQQLDRINSYSLLSPLPSIFFSLLSFHATMNHPTVHIPPTPPVRLQRCGICGNPMRDFAACKGTRTAVNRGKVMQQVTPYYISSCFFEDTNT
jgi:hypothetical protein